MRLIAMFLVVPIIEIALFIQVGGLIGLWPTLALVLLSAVAGVAIMRSQGARAGMQIQRSLAEMRDPSRPLAHGAMIIAACPAWPSSSRSSCPRTTASSPTPRCFSPHRRSRSQPRSTAC